MFKYNVCVFFCFKHEGNRVCKITELYAPQYTTIW